MKSSFEKLYITPVEIGEIRQSNGFYDDDAGDFVKETDLYADIQPYNGGLAEKEYGQAGQVDLRMFCPLLPEIIEMGKIARINESYYTITYAEHWDKGSMALLKRRMS